MKMQLIDKIKKEVPYLAAYAWLHNAALREGSDIEACRITIVLMHCIRKIEALGVIVQCFGSPEIEYFNIRLNGRIIMIIETKELELDDSETVS